MSQKGGKRRGDKDMLRGGNAEEQQAANTLGAAKAVATEIEALKNRVRDEARPARERQEAKAALFDATERMCNIMALAVFQLSASLSADFQSKLAEGFQELRQRLLHMGVHMMVERVDKIHKRANAVLKGEGYPIGLAMRLHAAYVELTNNLKTMGGDIVLTEEQQQLVLNTASMINKLAAIEEQIGMVSELGHDEVPQLPPEAS